MPSPFSNIEAEIPTSFGKQLCLPLDHPAAFEYEQTYHPYDHNGVGFPLWVSVAPFLLCLVPMHSSTAFIFYVKTASL